MQLLYMSRNQNCNFRKLKMADGRHFQNSIISISQPRIIRFWSYLVGRCIFQFPWWPFNKNSKFCTLKMADGPYWKSFLAIFRRHIDRLMRSWDRKYRITWQYRSRDQTAIFDNSRWLTAAILKIAWSPYLNYPISIKFGSRIHISIPRMDVWEKSKIIKFNTADRLHIKNRLFGYISAPYWLINAKLAQEIKNRMPIRVRKLPVRLAMLPLP